MNTIVELHDSTVAEIEMRDGTMIVHFQPAYLHRSEGRPGRDAGDGLVQEARLIFLHAAVSGDIPPLPCNIVDGTFVVGEEWYENSVPVPLENTGSIQLHLEFDRHKITITADGVRLELCGDPRDVEKFNPSL
jgi:hypothetical protein